MAEITAYVLQQDSIDGAIYQRVEKDTNYVPFLSTADFGQIPDCPECPPGYTPPTTGQIWPRITQL